MRIIVTKSVCVALVWSQLFTPAWAAVDIAQVPLDAISNVKPNIIFGMDDSGSMDFEVMLGTNDGSFWWDTSTKRGWDATGKFYFNQTGNTGSQSDGNWTKYAYLFPNGCASDKRILCDSNSHYAVPPTPQFAALRSSYYNPIYYDTFKTYSPWPSAYVSGSTRTFSAASPTAPRSHPVTSSTGSMNLTATLTSTSSNWIFRMLAGMVVPGATIPGIRTSSTGTGSWSDVTTDTTLTGSTWASIPYYPATFYQREGCTVDAASCVAAPDGATLKRYEIKAGNAFPSGRSYADEIQNFANWWQYYRKRKLMLSAAMGGVLSEITNVRGGVAGFNSRPANVAMYDFGASADAANYRAVIGQFYANPSSGGTPTRETLKYIGEQFVNNSNVVQHSCQRNAAFIVTDGFAYANAVTPPSYDRSKWGTPAPLGVPYTKTLADIALSYFTVNIRPDLAPGRVPYDAMATWPGADKNPDLHMNTYGITLGSRGTVWPMAGDPFVSPPSWPNPSVDKSPTSIDDLFLATLNGRGQMLLATDVTVLTEGIQEVINDIIYKAGAQSAVGLANPNVTLGSNYAYWSSYNGRGWTGDVNASTIDTASGAVSTAPLWSAGDLLKTRDWTTRKIGSFNGSGGVAFTAAAVGSRIGMGPGGTSEQLVNWLRGDRSQEGTLYRKRIGILGDVVNAEPALSPDGSVVYQAANDGMLHAFSAANGTELWAYVPGHAHAAMGALASKIYNHRFYVDGTPTVQKLDTGPIILVGGMRAGGAGFYALNVTNSTAASDADVASKVMWEFPNASTSSAIKNNLGLSYGRPVVVKTAGNGWVALLTSGYNTSGDGKGRVFMLNATTGSLIREFVTTATADLGQISAFVTQTAAGGYVADAVYGGDLAGNLWKFDLESGAVSLVATLKDAGGMPQPITAAPELTLVNTKRVILVGTGKLLGVSDFSPSQTHSFYAIADTGTPVADVRTELDPRTLVVSGETRTLSASAPDWSTRRGWYFDLPAGEIANTDPQVALGAVFFTTSKASSTACASESFLYMVDIYTGSQRPPEVFTSTPWTGIRIGAVLSSRPVLAQLPSTSLVALTHRSDNTIDSRLIAPPRAVNPRRAAWKEVQR